MNCWGAVRNRIRVYAHAHGRTLRIYGERQAEGGRRVYGN